MEWNRKYRKVLDRGEEESGVQDIKNGSESEEVWETERQVVYEVCVRMESLKREQVGRTLQETGEWYTKWKRVVRPETRLR